VLGRYRLLECLGTGGFGVVWRARDELLHREVAVKRVALGPDGTTERASREALASARLSHPAIVALYEACAEQDAFYMISELVDGETLAQLIAARALSDQEVLEIGIALANALSHAHSRGVIHRDVKPQNVLVPHVVDDPGGAAKLTDFGGACLAGEDVLTRTGDVLGTLAYMAPEQSEGREAAEPADLYALALVLYEALCGVNPVRGASPADTARRIGRPLAPLQSARGDLPRALTRTLDTALAPSPADRGTLDGLRLTLEETLGRGLGRPRRGRRQRRAGRELALEDRDRAPAGLADPAPAPAAPGTRRAPQGPPARPAGGPPESAPAPEAVARPDAPGIASLEPGSAGAGSTAKRGLALPRAAWLGCALAAIVWQAWVGHPGAALLLLAAALPLAALPRRVGAGWLLSALAPILGLAGLANAFPAIAGQFPTWRARAAIGALGYWWLSLAEPLFARDLWLGGPPGVPVRATWEGSLSSCAVHVLGPMVSLDVLLGAAAWAGAAMLLPLIVRGRSAMLDVFAALAWSVALLAAEAVLLSGPSVHAAHLSPRGAVLGAALGATVAVAARALRGPV